MAFERVRAAIKKVVDRLPKRKGKGTDKLEGEALKPMVTSPLHKIKWQQLDPETVYHLIPVRGGKRFFDSIFAPDLVQEHYNNPLRQNTGRFRNSEYMDHLYFRSQCLKELITPSSMSGKRYFFPEISKEFANKRFEVLVREKYFDELAWVLGKENLGKRLQILMPQLEQLIKEQREKLISI